MIEDYYGSQFKSKSPHLNQRQLHKPVTKLKIQNSIKRQVTESNLNHHQQTNLNRINHLNQKSQYNQFNSSRSKLTRTQNSRNKLRKAQQLKIEQMNIQKLKNKYLYSQVSNNNNNKQHQKSRQSGQNYYNKDSIQNKQVQRYMHQNSKSKGRKYLKTQNSKQKYFKRQNYPPRQAIQVNQNNYNNYSTSQEQQYYGTNNNTHNDYTQTQNNRSNDTKNPKQKNNSQDQSRPAYYQSSNQDRRQYQQQSEKRYYQRDSQQIQQRRVGVERHQNRQIPHRIMQNQTSSRNDDELTVTKSIGNNNRYSSLSLNKKITSNKLLTYYQCDAKRFYDYNDEGYLTDKQIHSRDKMESAAKQRFIKNCEYDQSNRLTKSISQTQFKYLNKLKAEVDKQLGRQTLTYEVNRLPSKTRENIDKSKQSKSEYPSQLPPSSSPSQYTNKFTVQYIPQVFNQNILKKNDLEDSYHQRQENKMKAHQKMIKQSARSSLIKKNKMKKGQIGNKKNQNNLSHQSFSSQSMSSQYSVKKSDNNNKGISKIGGIFSDHNSNIGVGKKQNKHQQQNLLQQISKYSRTQNKNKSQSEQSSSNQNISQSESGSGSESKSSSKQQSKSSKSSKDKKQEAFKNQIKQESRYGSLDNLDMINSNYKKIDKQQLTKNKSQISNPSYKQAQLIRIQSRIGQNKQKIKYAQNNSQLMNSSKIASQNKSAIKPQPQNRKLEFNDEYQVTNFKKNKSKKSQIEPIISNANNSLSVNKQQQKVKEQSQINPNNNNNSKLSNNSKIVKVIRLSQISKNKSEINKIIPQTQTQMQMKMQMQNESKKEYHNQLQINSNPKLGLDSKKNVQYVNVIAKEKLNDKSLSSGLKSQNQFLQNQNSKKRSSISIKQHKDVKKSLLNFAKTQSRMLSKIKIQLQNSKKSKASSFNQASNKTYKSQSNVQGEGFNFLQKINDLLNMEQQLHQNRKNDQTQSLLTQQFQQVLQKIQSHIFLIRFIIQTAASAYIIYPEQQSSWVYKSCFLSFKKYLLQRKKLIQALKGNKTCFKIAQYQLSEDDLKPYLQNRSIKTLVADIDYSNKQAEKILQEYVIYLKTNYSHEVDQSDINLRLFNDKNDLGILLKQYHFQIQGLRGKNNQESIDQQQIGQINQRIFHLMEVGFLYSQLSGKRIKQFQDQLYEDEDFQQYFEQYWPLFQHIQKTFS